MSRRKRDWCLMQDKQDPHADKHVVPNFDLRRHAYLRSCWCRPHISDEGEFQIIVHNSMDGRELAEPDHDPSFSPAVN